MAADPTEPVAIAILAKAPIAGFAKTRLIPALGEAGAATLQARLTERAVATATAAGTGPVTLWAAPDAASSFVCAACRALRASGSRARTTAISAPACWRRSPRPTALPSSSAPIVRR